MIDNQVRSARLLRTLDGDTFAASLDLAPRVKPRPTLEAHIRVRGWSAKELNEIEGPEMLFWFNSLLVGAQTIAVRLGPMSFERIVCDVYLDGVLFAGMLRGQLRNIRRRKQ